MSERSPRRISDVVLSLEGGMDSGRSPSVIDLNQVAFAINTTFRGSYPRNRPGFTRKTLNFNDDATVKSNFWNGLFQGAVCYVADSSVNCIIVSVGGRLFKIDVLNQFAVSDISIPSDLNSSLKLMAWMYQAENYLIVQDGESVPIIFDGAACRRSKADEIKTGTVGIYCNGRIWYALANGLSFRATDLVRGPSGTAATGYRDAVLKETENTFLNEGGDFSIPGSSGPIHAMAMPAMLDTALGQGPLQVFTTDTIFSVQAPIDRTVWKDLTWPIQTVGLPGTGATSARSTITVNGDIFYRDVDGLRSLVLANRSFATWGNTPISIEMQRVLSKDQRDLLAYSSAVLFDNRVVFTCWPIFHDRGVYHRALAVLNLDTVSAMRVKAPPSWDGLWNGLNVHQIIKGEFAGEERCFMFARNELNHLELWEMTRDDQFDNENQRITWSIETKQLFGGVPGRKHLEAADFFVDSIYGRVVFDVKWRPDAYPCWFDWHSWSVCSNNEQCLSAEGCQTLQNLQLQYRPKMRLPQPPDTCNESVDLPARDFWDAQFRIQVTGPGRLLRMYFHTIDVQESPLEACLGVGECVDLDCCDIDPLSYSITVEPDAEDESEYYEQEYTEQDSVDGGDDGDGGDGGDEGEEETSGIEDIIRCEDPEYNSCLGDFDMEVWSVYSSKYIWSCSSPYDPTSDTSDPVESIYPGLPPGVFLSVDQAQWHLNMVKNELDAYYPGHTQAGPCFWWNCNLTGSQPSAYQKWSVGSPDNLDPTNGIGEAPVYFGAPTWTLCILYKP